MLTKRLRECLLFIETFQQREGGVSPSMLEITHAMGGENKSSAHRLLCSLEARGFVRRLHGRARAIEVLQPILSVQKIPIYDAKDQSLRGYLP